MRGFLGAAAWMIGGGGLLAGLAYLLVAGGDLPSFGDGEPKPVAAVSAQGPQRPCPPAVSTPPRAPGAPVDDLYGVRIGFTVADAQAMISCRNARFQFEFEPIWHTAVAREMRNQRQLMQSRRPGEAVAVGLVGDLGQERVIAIWREESFPVAQAPSIDALDTGLVNQFGIAHNIVQSEFTRELVWSYDASGVRMDESGSTAPTTNRNLFDRMREFLQPVQAKPNCARHANLTWLDQPTWDAACGLTIRAVIDAQLDDKTRASRLRVVIVDQSRLARDVTAYRKKNGAS